MRQWMARLAKSLAVGGIVILITILGFVIGSFVGLSDLMTTEPKLPDWEPLNNPPEAVAHLVGVDDDTQTLYVQSTSGHYYACCWQLVEQPPQLDESPGQCSLSEMPSPPGKVLENMTHAECGGEWFVQYSYVLLSDGSVWEWQLTPNAYEGIGVLSRGLFYSICGTLSGLGIGILLVALPWFVRVTAVRKSRDG
ncbi:MAG: hypothetical protein JXB07_12630 [Anaerolineae bacterium]|nr:hypothetical protein [Anaerolineae bacterium]